MKSKIRNCFRGALVVALGVTFLAACSDDDDNNGNDIKDNNTPKTASISGLADAYPTVSFDAWEDVTFTAAQILIELTAPVTGDQTITFDVDDSKVAAYNSAMGTSYQALPAGTFEPVVATIGDKRFTGVAVLSFTGNPGVLTDGVYLAPVTMVGSSSDYISFDPDASTYYMVVNYKQSLDPVTLVTLDTSDPELNSGYIFPNTISLTQYTIECMFYIDSFSNNPRIMNITDAGEDYCNIFDFQSSRLRWRHGRGSSNRSEVTTTMTFETEQWYYMSAVFDGSTIRIYIDGELAASGSALDTSTFGFSRFDIGAVWSTENVSNNMEGALAQTRIWSKALNAAEMKEYKCSLDPSASGLEAYWKFDEGTGHIFYDATGNGYNMDWSDTARDVNGSGLVYNLDKSAYVQWFTDTDYLCW